MLLYLERLQWLWYWAVGRGGEIFKGHDRKGQDNPEQTVRIMDVEDSATKNSEGNRKHVIESGGKGILAN